MVRLFEGVNLPLVIATDKDQALMRAIEIVLPNARHLLCTWHISKNVLKHVTKHLEDGEKRASILKLWAKLVSSCSESVYHDCVHRLNLELEMHRPLMAYF
jgi:hypothetical protein